MKRITTSTLAALTILLFGQCGKDKNESVDTTYPEINITAADAFPKQCSVIKRGETIVFRAQLSDNVQLGSVSVDIHHNFDHHTHSTEVENCNLEPVKTPQSPFLMIKSFPIPAGLKTYQTAIEIPVPANVDAGDYHFMIRLTDKEGWQTIKGLSIKII
ncbi:DUF4625 domain-containing protein [Chitinophaga arvensicola]|uniref:DUF4625 domain-containing protein n=1 Tax=Chitinophaga arvensicola TaxID=29529 RepID=A0A1I0RSI8_9BACT|nr:DUF4625 domain-containing protein [Chitinophaga arvensicola]SEW44194.1 protein of unknown function [Chitinophaga arvensicola]